MGMTFPAPEPPHGAGRSSFLLPPTHARAYPRYSVNQKIIAKCWGFSSEQDRVNALLAQKTENKYMT